MSYSKRIISSKAEQTIGLILPTVFILIYFLPQHFGCFFLWLPSSRHRLKKITSSFHIDLTPDEG